MHSMVVFADIASEVTTVTDPGLIRQHLENKLPNKKPAPAGMVEETQEGAVSPTLEKIHLQLKKVIIKGNTVFSNEELQAMFKSSLDRTISLGDLVRLVNAITKKYRSQGYILSRALLPPQEIKNGVVTVQIIEGYISQATVEGNVGVTKSLLERYGKQITQLRPFQISYLERDMLLMNDLPGITVKAVIHPSKTIPGAADLVLVAERAMVQGNVSYDNVGTRYIGPQEIGVKVTLNSTMMAGDSNSLRYVTVPHTTELSFTEFIHTNPIGTNGLRFTLGGNYSQTHPLFTLSPVDVMGTNTYVFTDLTYPIWRTRTADLFVHSTFSYQNVKSTILSTLFYYDLIRPLTIGGNFDSSDSWQGYNNLSLNLEHGFNIMGATRHFLQSRPLAVPNYTKLMLTGSRLQLISDRFSLLGAFSGQYSCNPLLASVQYSYGGPNFGRGYDPSAIVGDDGLGAKIELRFSTDPEWRWLKQVQYYVFYDGGEIWNRDGVSLPAKQSAFSTGVGLRINFIPQISGNFYIAKPLTLPVQTLTAMGQNGNQWRSFFQLSLDV